MIPSSPHKSFATIAHAAAALDMTEAALRKAIARKTIPVEYVLRLGQRTIRVDLAGLVAHLRAGGQVRA